MLADCSSCFLFSFFFFNATATTEIYTLSLHDALPISAVRPGCDGMPGCVSRHRSHRSRDYRPSRRDRKSTRLNSSHMSISYAVFCLKKKKHKTSKHPPMSQHMTSTIDTTPIAL